MTSSDSLAFIVITFGAFSAIVLFILLIFCCRFTSNLRKKQHRTGGLCHRTIIFEQTTTSDDNNAELFSCCLDESTSMVHPERESDPISSSYATGDFDDDHAHQLKSLGSTVATVAVSTVGQINHSNPIKQSQALQSTNQVTMVSSGAAPASNGVVSFTPLTTHQPSPVKMPHAINVLYMESSASVSSAQGDTSEGEVSLKSSQQQPLPVDTIDSGKLLRKMDQMNQLCQKSAVLVPRSAGNNEIIVVNRDSSKSDVFKVIDKSIDRQQLPASSQINDKQVVVDGEDEDEECSQSAGETITSVTTTGDPSSSVPLIQSTTATGLRLLTKSDRGKRFTRSISGSGCTLTSVTGEPPVESVKCIDVPKVSNKEPCQDAKVTTSRIQCNAQSHDQLSSCPAQAHNPVPCSSFSSITSQSKVNLQPSTSSVSSALRSEKGEIDSSIPLSTAINIKRQESVDLPDDHIHRSFKGICVKDSSVESSGSERSPETIRKQYKELWQLRAEFHAEEIAKERARAALAAVAVSTDPQCKSSPSSSSSAGSVVLSSSSSLDTRPPADSGYKSLEGRKDYSIDHKTESIYRQFTSAEGIGVKVPSAHPSIEEEEEEEEEEEVIFV